MAYHLGQRYVVKSKNIVRDTVDLFFTILQSSLHSRITNNWILWCTMMLYSWIWPVALLGRVLLHVNAISSHIISLQITYKPNGCSCGLSFPLDLCWVFSPFGICFLLLPASCFAIPLGSLPETSVFQGEVPGSSLSDVGNIIVVHSWVYPSHTNIQRICWLFVIGCVSD